MNETEREELDRDVRLHIYRRFLERGRPPTVTETAAAIDRRPADVEAAYHRLADGRAIVLAPGTSEIWMAMPFSARPTPFRVRVGERWWWGVCVWDSLGIPTMVSADADIFTTCPDCDEPMRLTVRDDQLERADGVAHFAVPAARWWDDIGFT